MESAFLIDRLEANAGAVSGLLRGVPRDQAVWRPAPGKWSILEVAAHLLDEEREDFRVRLEILLRSPGAPWPPIDPQAWVVARRYGERDLAETLETWLDERSRSVAWLRALEEPAWENAQEHPAAGVLRAGDMLASWVAHDFLHLRQLARLHYLHVSRRAKPHSSAYAGDW